MLNLSTHGRLPINPPSDHKASSRPGVCRYRAKRAFGQRELIPIRSTTTGEYQRVSRLSVGTMGSSFIATEGVRRRLRVDIVRAERRRALCILIVIPFERDTCTVIPNHPQAITAIWGHASEAAIDAIAIALAARTVSPPFEIDPNTYYGLTSRKSGVTVSSTQSGTRRMHIVDAISSEPIAC